MGLLLNIVIQYCITVLHFCTGLSNFCNTFLYYTKIRGNYYYYLLLFIKILKEMIKYNNVIFMKRIIRQIWVVTSRDEFEKPIIVKICATYELALSYAHKWSENKNKGFTILKREMIDIKE